MNEFTLKGKTIIVTGALGLIGKEICDAYAEYGANLALLDIYPHKIGKIFSEQLKDKYKVIADYKRVDIAKRREIDLFVMNVVKRYKRIDVLVNLAAIDAKFDDNVTKINKNRFENYPIENLDFMYKVNIKGTVMITQRVVKEMLKYKRGNIINVASTYSIVAPDQRIYKINNKEIYKPVDYVITKSYIPNFTRYLAALYGKDGIRVNTIMPHGVYNNHDQEFIAKFSQNSPMHRMCQKSELRGGFIFLASDSSSYMTGSILKIDGGWTSL